MSNRGVWDWPEGRGWRDDGISVTRHKDGCLTVEVCDEQAVDSYNYHFETRVVLPPDVARALIAWLTGKVAGNEPNAGGTGLQGAAGQRKD